MLVGISVSRDDRRKLSAQLKSIEREGESTEKSLSEIGSGAERSQKKATGAFGRIARSLRTLRKDTSRPVGLKVNADHSGVDRATRAVQGLRNEGKRDVTVVLKAEVADALADLGKVDQAKRDASGKATVHVDAETASALSKARVVEAAYDRIDGRDIDMAVDVDTGGALAGLAAFRAAASAVGGAVRGMDAGLSAGGVRLAMIGGVAATAAALFAPLLGALASVGSLGASAGLGIGLIFGPLTAVTTKLGEYHKVASDADSTTREIAEAARGLSPAMLGLYDTFIRARDALDNAFGPAQDAVSRLASRVLNDAIPAFGVFARTSTASINALGRAWDGFVSRLRMPTQQASVGTILGITPEVVERLSSSVGSFGLALVNILAAAAPSALRLAGFIENISDNLLRWSGSTSGVNAVRSAIASAVPVMSALFNAAVQVGGALFRFGVENAPAIATAINIISSALTAVINGFSWLTRVFGPIVPLVAALTPVFLGLALIFGQVGSLIVSLVTGFGSIVTVLGTVATALGVGLLPLLAALALAVGAAAAGVYVLYRAWGAIRPALQPVIDLLGRLKTVIAGLFTGNTGTEQFKRAFASLPGPVQNAIRLIVAGFRQLKAVAGPILTSVGNAIRTGLGAAFRFVSTQATRFVNFVRTSFTQLRAASQGPLSVVARILRTVLGAALTFVLGNVRILVNWWRQNLPLIRQATQVVLGAVATIFRTTFRVIGTVVRVAFNLIRAIVTTGMRITGTVVRTGLNLLLRFWRANSTQITAILRSFWRILTTIFRTALRVVLGIIKAGLQLLVGDWRGALRTLQSTAQTVWRAIETIFRNVLRIIVNVVKVAWNTLRSVTTAAFNAIRSFLQNTWNRIRDTFRSVLNSILDFVRQSWNTLKSVTSAAFDAVRDAISSRIEAARDRVRSVISDLVSAAKNKFDELKNIADAAFNAIRDFMANPIENARDRIADAINAIIGIVNGILKAFGQDPINVNVGDNAAGVRGFARGGTSAGGVARTHRRGVDRFARGGMGTRGANPRMHLWNEQQGGEAFIAEKRPAREQLPYLKTAAAWHDYAVVPANPQKGVRGSYRDFAEGGLASPKAGLIPVRAFQYGGGKGAMYEAVLDKFGVQGRDFHAQYLTGPAAVNSIDWMVTADGNRAEGKEKELGDNIASFVAPPSTVTTIWYGQANFGSGWQPYSTGPGIGNANTLGHYDHVHGEAHPTHFKGEQGTFPGGGGGILGGLSGPSLADQIWEGEGSPPENWREAIKKSLIDTAIRSIPVIGGLLGLAKDLYPGLKKLLPDDPAKLLPESSFGSGVISEALGKFMGKYKDWVRGYVYDEFGSTGGEGGPGTNFEGGGDPAKNRALGEKMLDASGVPGEWSSLDSLWTKESGWDQYADNPTSDAYGIPQGMMGPGGHVPPPGYMPPESDPAVQIDWGLDYISKTYGSTDEAWGHSQSVGWYEKGGLAIGPQLLALSERGKELVLPLENAQVMRSAQTALGTAELRSEMQAMRQELSQIRSGGIDINDFKEQATTKILVGNENGARRIISSREGGDMIRRQTIRQNTVVSMRGSS